MKFSMFDLWSALAELRGAGKNYIRTAIVEREDFTGSMSPGSGIRVAYV